MIYSEGYGKIAIIMLMRRVFIKELLEGGFMVNFITRPRRFGKNLSMSMLSEFFDIRKESKELFTELDISKEEEICEKWQNKWSIERKAGEAELKCSLLVLLRMMAAHYAKPVTGCLLVYRYDCQKRFERPFFSMVGRRYRKADEGVERTDIVVENPEHRRAMVIEIKRSKTEKQMEADYDEALLQISREKYAEGLLDGYETILKYGAAFFKKKCRIKLR